MKFAICNEIFQNWKLEQVMPFVAAAGYDGLEIAPFTLAKSVLEITPSQREHIRELAREHNLEITGIHWVLVQTEGLHLTHPDAEVRQKTSAYFVDLVNFCADIGGTRIVVGSPKQRNLLEGVTHAEGWRHATEVFRPAVKRAEERGIVLCLEPLAPLETNFINTAEEAIRFTEQFASKHFQVILDVKAMSSEEKAIPQIIEDSAGKFAYFHANDKNLKGPGFGEVDFRPIAAALRKVGYAGVVSVEVFNFDEGPEEIATRSLRYLKQTFA
ncbi:MAG TPA: sugar phosphate isomerase/epimerase family protein [Methylomirabilota bacterium]|nr:sugar phosphate isomerase/epimerase family protein [Methylomirabilota bacterium]